MGDDANEVAIQKRQKQSKQETMDFGESIMSAGWMDQRTA
jgi:hypothetical protein